MVAWRDDGGGRCAVVLLGWRWHCGGVSVVVDTALPGQEGNHGSVRRGSNNQHVVGGGCSKTRGGGGSRISRILPRWTLFGVGKEEVAATTAAGAAMLAALKAGFEHCNENGLGKE